MEISHHTQHAAEPDVQSKGLSRNSVGLLGGIILAISCVAPAYTLTATIGLLAGDVGEKAPAVFLMGFVPMFFVAFAYRELNKVVPDCGTSFTWTTKAFGPYIGWLGGWTAVLATVIVISNLAGIAVQFAYQLVGDIVNSPWISDLWQNKPVNVLTCLLFLAIATFVAYRGITTTARLQYILVSFQLAVLVAFAVFAIAESSGSETSLSFSWSWFSPAGLTVSAIVAGLSGSIFAFWGWDSALTVNEETKNSSTTSGKAAILAVVSILCTYLLVSIAVIMYAGVGDTGLGLANEEISDNVFGALAQPIMGNPWYLLLFGAVLASSAASLITTFLPTSRTLLAMGSYGALPARFAAVHPRFLTPSFSTLAAGVGAGVFYAVLTFLSENVLLDTIYSIGIMICFYYGLTAFACVWFFRRELFIDPFSVVFKFLLPLIGGIILAFVFVVTLRDSFSPEFGSGGSIGGVGLVFIMGVGLILFGFVLIAIQRVRHPAFFRGETLKTDTPSLIVD
jgi:amino acid transporter